MFVRQFYVESLGHYSYLIGSLEAGVGFAVDPKRDVADYVDEAEAMGLRITHILETHLHNDYVSGARQLAAATGATIGHSAAAGLAYPHQPLHEGDILRFGELEVRVLETPGHTPEHLAYVLYDTDAQPRCPGPDPQRRRSARRLGRPARSAGARAGPHAGAAALRQPPRQDLACGRRHAGVADARRGLVLRRGDLDLAHLDGGLREGHQSLFAGGRQGNVCRRRAARAAGLPAYYRRMRPTNQQGPRVIETLPRPVGLARRTSPRRCAPPTASRWTRARRRPSVERTCRARSMWPLAAYSAPGQAPSCLPDRPIFLITERTEDVEEAVCQLMRIGLEAIPAFLRGGLMAWTEAGLPVDTIGQISAQELWDDVDGPRALQPLDVRRDDEWQAGHIPGALHIVGNDIPDQMERLPRDRPIAVVCGSGYRSSVAASLLRRAGFPDVRNVIGGMAAWDALNYPAEKDSTAPAGSNGRRSRIGTS